MPHKFKIGTVVNYQPKDRVLSAIRATYTVVGHLARLRALENAIDVTGGLLVIFNEVALEP